MLTDLLVLLAQVSAISPYTALESRQTNTDTTQREYYETIPLLPTHQTSRKVQC